MARPNGACRSDFEAYLLQLMGEAGYQSYHDLAAAAEVHRSTIQRLADGKYRPSYATLIKLARALKCSVDELVTAGGESSG